MSAGLNHYDDNGQPLCGTFGKGDSLVQEWGAVGCLDCGDEQKKIAREYRELARAER